MDDTQTSGLAPATSTTACLNQTNIASFTTLVPCSSLRKYKSHVGRLSLALPEVMKLKPVAYTWKSTGKREIGFIAEEIEQLDPRLSSYDGDGHLQGVQYDHMIALLARAIQEQQKEIEKLRAKVGP